jgi:hypothetical protein
VGIPEKEIADVGIGVSVGGSGETVGNGVTVGVNAGLAVCVSAITVLAVNMAVSITSVGLTEGVDKMPSHDVNIVTIRNKGIIALLIIFMIPLLI